MMMNFYLTVERPRKPGHNLLLGFHGKFQGIFPTYTICFCLLQYYYEKNPPSGFGMFRHVYPTRCHVELLESALLALF